MSTADLDKATRELFLRTRIDEVYMATPVLDEIKRRDKVTFSGGKYVEKLAKTATTEDQAQNYTANEALTDQKTNVLDKPRFRMKYGQFPLRYDVDEYTENATAGNEEALLDVVEMLVEDGNDGVRRHLSKAIFNDGGTTVVSDTGKKFQSLVSALDHDQTYGNVSRSFSGGTNDWWQGADPAGLNEVVTSSSQGTATTIGIANCRKWVTETSVMHNMKGPNDLTFYMCPTLYNKLRAEMESKLIYKPGDPQRQGFENMVLDGYKIVSVPYLQTSTTMKTWVFILNHRFWEFRIHTARNFIKTPFKWQGENANGYDYWLARIMWKGNLVCWKPNSSMWLSNVS